MTNRTEKTGTALSLLIVFTMVLGGLLAVSLSIAPAARAASCSQTNALINGNWIINTPQVCSGIMYTIDGSVFVIPGGNLTLVNGGLSFAKDQSHTGYFLTVYGGGSLTLDNSVVTTQTNVIQPYLFLNISVSGTASSFTMQNGAMLKFPGWFNASSSATITVTGSTITGFGSQELSSVFGSTTDSRVDLNNDAPVISWSATSASLYRSTLDKLYELQGGNAQNIQLSSASNLYTYDTFIGVDYSNLPASHNEIVLSGSSHAYLYNVTVDTTESPTALSNYQPAFVPDATSTVYLLRWLGAKVTDSFGSSVAGAGIWSRLSPSPTTAQYPDNGFGTTPSATTLAYLGMAAGTWNVTDASGMALIPLWTDTITQATLPNANSFGDYQENATYQTYKGGAGVSYTPYPNLTAANNYKALTIVLGSAIICPSTVTVWGSQSFTGTVSLSGSLEIDGAVTITDGGIYLDQQANACSFLKVRSTGTLTLINANIWSNYALSLDVQDGGDLVASRGSQLLLTQGGSPGLLRSDGTTSTVSLIDTTVSGNVQLAGASATLIRDTFNGPGLSISTQSKTQLWDASLPGVTSLSLGTDLGINSSVAFDIRNVTFDQQQTSGLLFGGTQYVQFTNVQFYDPTGTWYLSMISGDAVVARYWWLTINAVDGTGTLLAEANASILLNRVDPKTPSLQFPADPTGGLTPGDNIYGTTSTSWPVAAPTGSVLYKAFMESRTATSGGRIVNNSYVANGTAFLQLTTYRSDSSVQVVLTTNTVILLPFSTLTPDLTVSLLTISGSNGNSPFQPINTNITLTATIHNSGQISVKNVDVAFYSTIVDANGDGYMDQPTSSYASVLIAMNTIAVVPKNGSATTSAYWTPAGSVETSVPVSVVVDPPLVNPTDGGAIRETNEANNILPVTLTLFTWPDLVITSADIQLQADPVVNNNVPIQVSVHNFGTNAATEASVQLFESGQNVSVPLKFSVSAGSTATQLVTWRPSSIGVHNLYVLVITKNDTTRNKDYNFVNNVASLGITVVTQPDLALFQSEFAASKTAQQDVAFPITVPVHNLGQTTAVNTSVAVYLNGNRGLEWGRTSNVSVLAGSETNVTVQVKGISTPDVQTLMIIVDPDNRLNEGGLAQENNNYANLTVSVLPPTGRVYIGAPNNGTVYAPTDTILVTGVVRDTSQNGIAGLIVNVTVMQGGQAIPGMTYGQATDSAGAFSIQVPLNGLADGTYTIRVTPASPAVASSDATITVRRNVPFLDSPVPILGIPWWLMLVILAAAAAVLIGVTVYFKVYGLGKMVECGECGAFIPEDATTCPKCGVEFEKDMAKCSNCQAWIPVDVKQCPECGVEFATGQVEMADYQEKMRLQYDEVVQKFKEEASRQLGRALSDREFQDWWRKQPTFVTFEDWLREEEEMRKMGSKPCPVCGTLNSVTATVCHKCGSLLKETPRPPTGGAGGVPPVARQAAQPASAPSQPQAPPPGGAQTAPARQDMIPRRVIRKPVQAQPVVQKRVIKRPMGEGEQGESTEGGEGQSSDEKPEDEL